MVDLKALFLKAYSNLPEDERSQIIVVIDGKPHTWNASYFEIKSNTKLGEKILNKLKKLEILNE